MEQITNNPAEKKEQELVELDGMPQEQFETMAKNLMTEGEKQGLMRGELDWVRRIARKKIDTMENPPSIHDAIADALIIRLSVKESAVFAINKEGQVVGSGDNRIEALRQGQQ